MGVRHRRTRAKHGVGRAAWIARGVSVLLAAGYIVAAVVIQDGVTRWTLILAIALLLPLLLIWFPHAIGSAKNYRLNRQHIDEPTPPMLISAAGWFFLVGLPVIFYMSWRG